MMKKPVNKVVLAAILLLVATPHLAHLSQDVQWNHKKMSVLTVAHLQWDKYDPHPNNGRDDEHRGNKG